jgi:hypothetical protein
MDKEGVDKIINKDKEFLLSTIDFIGMAKKSDPVAELKVRELRQNSIDNPDKPVRNMDEFRQAASPEILKTIDLEKAEEELGRILAHEAHEYVVTELEEGRKPDIKKFQQPGNEKFPPIISEKHGSYYIRFPSYKHIQNFMYTRGIKPHTKGAYDYFEKTLSDGRKIETAVWRGTGGGIYKWFGSKSDLKVTVINK